MRKIKKRGGDQIKSLSSKVGVTLIGLIIFSYGEVWGTEWTFITEDRMENKWYVDSATVQRERRGEFRFITCQVKQVYGNKYKANDRVGWSRGWLHQTLNIEIWCDRQLWRATTGTVYKTDGTTFDVDHIQVRKKGNMHEWTSMFAQDVQQKRDSVLGDQVSKHAVGFIADEFCGGLRDKW